MQNLLAVDIGGTAIKAGIWKDNQLETIPKKSTPKTWQALKEILFDWIEIYGPDGVAISTPGSVDVSKGIIYGISAVPYIHRFEIRKELQEAFNLPVSIQNDANCAALAELWQGNAQNLETVAFMIIGSGIGGAYVCEGKLQSGAHLFGGEFGYQILNGESLATLSESASPVSVAQRYTEQRQDGTIYTGEDLFNLAQSGDKLAKDCINSMYDALAIGIYNISLAIDPERVLIGGGISKQPALIENLKSKVGLLLEKTGASELKFELECCRFYNDANLMGAVYQFILENGANLK